MLTKTRLYKNNQLIEVNLEYDQDIFDTYIHFNKNIVISGTVRNIVYDRIITSNDLNNEIWKVIPDSLDINYKSHFIDKNAKYITLYDSKYNSCKYDYCVSNLGRLGYYYKDSNTIILRKLLHVRTNSVYFSFRLHEILFSAHKITALLFNICPNYNIEYYKEIDHIDNCPLNNSSSNLQWVSPLQNSKKRNDQRGENIHDTSGNRGERINIIICENIDTHEIIKYDSPTKTSEALNIPYNKVTEYCRNESIVTIQNKRIKFSYKKDMIVKVKIWEPIIRIKDEEDQTKFTILGIYIKQEDFNNAFKDTVSNIDYYRRNVLKSCKHNERENTTIYGSEGDRWIYLKYFNDFAPLDKKIDIDSLTKCDIVKLTIHYKFIERYTNLYEIVNLNIKLDKVLSMCDSLHEDINKQVGIVKQGNLQRKFIYTGDYLKLMNITDLDQLDKNMIYIEE